MLGFMRRKAQSKVLQAIILMIILVFIFWGVGSNQGSVQNAVATVNGESITFQDYQKEYDATVSKLRDQFGGNIPQGLLDTLNLDKQVLTNLIQKTLMRQGAAKMGLYVSDAELMETIQNMEAFQNNGVFDVQWYEQVLTSSRMTVSKFEESMRYDLLSAKVLDQFSRFGLISEDALQDYFQYRYGMVKLQYAALDGENYQSSVEVTDQKLAEYYEANKDQYKSPQKIKLNYLSFRFDDAGLATSVSDEEIANYYEKNKSRFSFPEERNARHILIRTQPTDTQEQLAEKRAKAEEILAQIKEGAAFADLARQYSEDGSAARGGDLGFFARGQMVEPFENAVFNLKTGEVSDVVETQFGYHLIELVEIRPAYTKTLDEVKSEIAAQLSKENAKAMAFKAANEAYESIIMAGSLQKYAEGLTAESPVQIRETDYFSQADPPQDLIQQPEVVNAAFTLKTGELSSLVESSKGYAILYLADTKEREQLSLDEVREQVKEAFIKEDAARLAKEAAEAILAKLQEGTSLADAVADSGTTVEETPLLNRAQPADTKLPLPVVEKCYNLSENRPYLDEVAANGQIYYVVAYKERQAADEALFEEKKAELRTQLAQERSGELLAAWLEYLQQKAKVKTNEQFFLAQQ